MSAVIEEIKEGKYKISEYQLDNDSEAKVVECVPESSAQTQERLKVNVLNDLKVLLSETVPSIS